jgi:ATP-dependent DNA helicase RecQ
VRKVLAGAARMKGRYGKQMLAKMLIGSKAKEMTKGGLDRLSTYGLLSELKESEGRLIDALPPRLLMQEETPPSVGATDSTRRRGHEGHGGID